MARKVLLGLSAAGLAGASPSTCSLEIPSPQILQASPCSCCHMLKQAREGEPFQTVLAAASMVQGKQYTYFPPVDATAPLQPLA